MLRSPAPVKSAGAFRTIGEVATELDVPQHVLRFWESKFPEIRPLKRGGGRRYYRPEDVELLRRVQSLLHTEGYTIKGARRLISDGETDVAPEPPPSEPTPPVPPQGEFSLTPSSSSEPRPGEVAAASEPRPISEGTRRELALVLAELRAIRDLATERGAG